MTASFHDVVFPLTPDMGLSGGGGWHTTVLTLASGFEQRNQDWSKARNKYNVGATVRSDTDLFTFIDFFHARRGRLFGFLYDDLADNRCPFWANTPGDFLPLQTLFTTDGTTAAFPLSKLYGDTASTYPRIIKKPKPGLALFNNATPMVLTSDFTYSLTTGIVTLSNTMKATTGHLITGSFGFYTPVRFDIDDLNQVITDFGNNGVPNIPLLEVRLP
jgi:uncharacterized protein (TIGR02217 family)